MGEVSGVEDFADGEEGKAMSTEVRVVERGIEAERRARRDVWRRWGRSRRVCLRLATAKHFRFQKILHTVSTPIDASSSGRLRTCRVI